MTSPSTYHYVESSSRLLDDEEEDETLSLEETGDQLAPETSHGVGFYQDEDISDQQQYEKNLVLHANRRNRTTSLCKDEAELSRKRRTSSFSEHKAHLQVPNHNHANNRHTSHADNMNIKSSFKKILNAGKQIVPAFQHSISVHSAKKPPLHHTTPSVQNSSSFKYNRSQSYKQHDNDYDMDNLYSEMNAHTVTGGQYDSYLKQKDSKLNFLSRSFDSEQDAGNNNHLHNHFKQNMHHNQLHTPASVAEESLSTASSTSQSSTPSSSLSKNNRLNLEGEEGYSLLATDDQEREKLFVDSNNNLVKGSTGELVRMGGLKFTRTKSDSIRMRNYSSANDSVHRRPQDLLVEANRSNTDLLGNNGLDSPSSSDDGSQTAFKKNLKENSNRRNYGTCFSNYFVISLMFMLNLLNYIDRYTLAGN